VGSGSAGGVFYQASPLSFEAAPTTQVKGQRE